MWNNLFLKPPPTNSFLGKPNLVDTHTLNTSLQKLIDEIQKCKKNLHIEAAILSRLIYRLKLKFRKDKGMKAMQKIKSSLYKYLKLNIIDDINRFMKSIPINTKQGNVYYPTRQMLEYVMVRIQSFSKLMVRIVNISMELCQLCINRMKLGHFWNIALINLALSSRIGSLCQHMIEASCICYDNLYPMRNQLSLFGTNWLEFEYVFPPNLRIWLDLMWTPEDLKLIEERRLEMPIMIIDEEEDDDVQFCYEYKNDCIILDDTIKIAEDDVQFVEEYIDLITKMNPRMRNNKNIIEVNSDRSSPNSDIQIVTMGEEKNQLINDVVLLMDDDDIGEKIERNKEENDKIVNNSNSNANNFDTNVINTSDTNGIITKDVNEFNINDMNNFVNLDMNDLDRNENFINIDTSSTNFSSPENKKRRKRKRKSKQEIEIQNKILEHIQSTPPKKANISVISIDDTPLPSTSNTIIQIDSDTSFNISVEPTLTESLVEIDSDLSMVGNVFYTPLNNQNERLDLSNIKSISDINTFLHNEIKKRKEGNFGVSKHLNKKKWNKLIKNIEDVLSKRKSLKQSKNVAVDMAKNIIRSYIDNK